MTQNLGYKFPPRANCLNHTGDRMKAEKSCFTRFCRVRHMSVLINWKMADARRLVQEEFNAHWKSIEMIILNRHLFNYAEPNDRTANAWWTLNRFSLRLLSETDQLLPDLEFCASREIYALALSFCHQYILRGNKTDFGIWQIRTDFLASFVRFYLSSVNRDRFVFRRSDKVEHIPY